MPASSKASTEYGCWIQGRRRDSAPFRSRRQLVPFQDVSPICIELPVRLTMALVRNHNLPRSLCEMLLKSLEVVIAYATKVQELCCPILLENSRNLRINRPFCRSRITGSFAGFWIHQNINYFQGPHLGLGTQPPLKCRLVQLFPDSSFFEGELRMGLRNG